MYYSRICENCWSPFRTQYKNVKLCWDCERLEIIKRHPEVAIKDARMQRHAFDNGITFEYTEEGIKVREFFTYEDKDEQWRSDLNKIKTRARRHGWNIPDVMAWDLAAMASMRRAAAKYAPKKLTRRKATETTEDGKIIIKIDGQ